jgi:hypothetical protein
MLSMRLVVQPVRPPFPSTGRCTATNDLTTACTRREALAPVAEPGVSGLDDGLGAVGDVKLVEDQGDVVGDCLG